MTAYSYVAIDARGIEKHGTLDVSDQGDALQRIKEMGLFPTKVSVVKLEKGRPARTPPTLALDRLKGISARLFSGRVKPTELAVFTRNLSTLIEAGMPLLRGLRTLQEQEESRALRQVIGRMAFAIENGSSLAESLAFHPKVFNRLYINMVKAGELGGALDMTLNRLAEFMETAQRIKGRVKTAMFYPCAVLLVAVAVVGVMITFVIPRFKQVFDGLMNGMAMPAFTVFVFNLSEIFKQHIVMFAVGTAALIALLMTAVRTKRGRRWFDRFKLVAPVLGPVFRKIAISRFTRTLGTLIGSGVPILQALTILGEAAGNVIVGNLISTVHERVKEGETIAPTLKSSAIFPAMVAGMVDVGEQTGALPEMLMKIADRCDEEVDNATSAMTSLLEPVMLVFLAVVVGSIVIAMFLPLVSIISGGFDRTDQPGN